MKLKYAVLCLSLILPLGLLAQSDQEIEEVVVVGSQIKGAKITGALPVSIISSDDIDALGVESGDELLDNIAELGQNTFNQNEFSGGYNASRGDVGAFNLRDIGTGNTLTLLNGRRLITSPGYQTEPILGGSMPVFTTNSNAIPVHGADRIEILRDGASAIYGADALAGVVNTVLKSNFVGTNVRYRMSKYDHFAATDHKISAQWGKDIGNTNISIYFDAYHREEIRGDEDPKWLTADATKVPGLDPNYKYFSEFNDTTWRNTSDQSRYGIWSGGKNYLHVRPNSGNCAYTGTGGDTCIYSSTSSAIASDSLRARYNDTRWMRPDLQRENLFVFINSELSNGVEAYTEIGYYHSFATQVLFPGTSLGSGGCGKSGKCTQPLLIPLSNYWLQQLVDDDGNKLVDDTSVISNGLGLYKSRHRFDSPRGYDSDRVTLRFLQGFRGALGNWDWDGAILWSDAKSKQKNTNRMSLSLFDQNIALSTPNAYNPFCGGNGCGDETPFIIDIFRENTTELFLVDFKISNNNIYELPAGPIAALIGFESREEEYVDGRDPRIDGRMPYSVPIGPKQGETFPIISDVINSSATPASSGSRTTTSLFTEFQIPLHETLDAQIAVRYEDADDYGDATVGKLALGWQPIDQVKLRYAFSETFRAPALILVNEGFLGRSSSKLDRLMELVDYGDPEYSMQRITEGNKGLKAELGENESIGLVLEPVDNLIITLDKWSIETEDTVGIFGMTNAILLDLLIRLEGGPTECTGNPNVIRSSDIETANWSASNLCPAGLVQKINDYYVNGDTRTIEGFDTSILYSVDTDFGKFSAKFVNVHYDTKNQEAGGDGARLSAAANGGVLSGIAEPRGVNDLLGRNGSIEDKYTMKLGWRNGPYEVFLSGTQWGDFVETGNSEKTSEGTVYWPVDSMRVLNLTLGYKFDNDLRVRLQVKNLEDERAPLADEAYGQFWADLHTDYGRNFTVEFFKKF